MVYGLLHWKIREKVPRESVTSYNELLKQARLAEETFVPAEPKPIETGFKDKKRCSYCKNLEDLIYSFGRFLVSMTNIDI